MILELNVNGAVHSVDVEPRKTLADVLRDDLGLTGTHLGCEHGVCGACTVLLDDSPVRACLMFAVQCDETEITTVEGLAEDDRLNPVQRAFVEEFGMQCGFCTPGFVMLVEGARRSKNDLTDEELVELLASNLCRCTGYVAIKSAAEKTLRAR
jgi:carbon-monoxide dehydrogenase small subunit